MVKILIADDHAVVRKGLKQVFAETRDLRVIDEAATGQEVLDKVAKQKFDVVVLDISMPGRSGLEILRQLTRDYPHLRVLIFTMHDEQEYALRALQRGAAGYATKDMAMVDVVKAVRQIVAGGKFLSPALSEALASHLGGSSEKLPHQTLSDREYEVFFLIASGKPLELISKQLSVSAKTVTTYRTRVLQKMGLKTNAELVHYAIQHGLVKLPQL